jgi:hypothetical protein
LDRALLGMLKFEEILPLKLEEMARKPKKKRRKRQNKSSSPVGDTHNVAAATTTPERLEPDPARACPAPRLRDENVLNATETQG